jgi:hypothetical protein
MKFRDLERGPAQGRTEDFELWPGVTVKIRFVPVLAGKDREIETGAAEYARSVGAEPKQGEPSYERGVYAHTVWRGALDPDDGAPIFASIDEMLDKERGLDRDRLAMLFELQQQAQADFAPRAGTLTNAQFFEWLEKTAEAPDGTDLPFESSPRAMRRAFARGMARLYRETAAGYLALLQETARLRSEIASLTGKSSPGPGSPDIATNLQPSAESPPAQPPSPAEAE